MGQSIVSWFIDFFGGRTGAIVGVLIISMVPVIELRGAIPIALLFKLDWQTAILCSIIGNMLPVPIILVFLEAVFNFMKKHNILKNWVLKLERKALSKKGTVSKLKFWGLAAFVGIPLPGTGAWTGSLIASVLKMKKKSSLLSIFIGVVAAAVVVTLIVYGGAGLLSK